jgi:division protein CdvB (Snf7/Vps24/ESCRT-III family)
MIKDFFHRTKKPVSELILETTRELGKCYSRLELASSKLSKRNEDLFDACSFYMGKGNKARATVYANEVAEIRKVLSFVQHTQLSVERAILRLDTLKVVSPTLESLEGAFSDVKNALGLVANVMPSITPEISMLTSVVDEILAGTQFTLDEYTPVVVADESAEAIIEEAANTAEQELKARIPEPPAEVEVPKAAVSVRPLVALAADGTELVVSQNSAVIQGDSSSDTFDVSSFLLEELVMDYIERNNGEMNVTRCSQELNLPSGKVLEVLEVLNGKGKITIHR